jgi:hypothetical protein
MFGKEFFGFLCIVAVIFLAGLADKYVHWALALTVAGAGAYLIIRFRHRFFGTK